MNAEVLFENYGLKPYVFFSFSGYPAFQITSSCILSSRCLKRTNRNYTSGFY